MPAQSYAVIGAGNGGKAMAAHLALMGFEVALFNRSPGHIEAIRKRGGIELESQDGGPRGFGRLARVTETLARKPTPFRGGMKRRTATSTHRSV